MMKAKPASYSCQVHAQFELGEEVNDDASLVVQNSQVFLIIVLCVCGLVIRMYGVWTAGLALLLSLLGEKETSIGGAKEENIP